MRREIFYYKAPSDGCCLEQSEADRQRVVGEIKKTLLQISCAANHLYTLGILKGNEPRFYFTLRLNEAGEVVVEKAGFKSPLVVGSRINLSDKEFPQDKHALHDLKREATQLLTQLQGMPPLSAKQESRYQPERPHKGSLSITSVELALLRAAVAELEASMRQEVRALIDQLETSLASISINVNNLDYMTYSTAIGSQKIKVKHSIQSREVKICGINNDGLESPMHGLVKNDKEFSVLVGGNHFNLEGLNITNLSELKNSLAQLVTTMKNEEELIKHVEYIAPQNVSSRRGIVHY